MSETVLQSAMFLMRELLAELLALHEKVDHLRQEVKQRVEQQVGRGRSGPCKQHGISS